MYEFQCIWFALTFKASDTNKDSEDYRYTTGRKYGQPSQKRTVTPESSDGHLLAPADISTTDENEGKQDGIYQNDTTYRREPVWKNEHPVERSVSDGNKYTSAAPGQSSTYSEELQLKLIEVLDLMPAGNISQLTDKLRTSDISELQVNGRNQQNIHNSSEELNHRSTLNVAQHDPKDAQTQSQDTEHAYPNEATVISENDVKSSDGADKHITEPHFVTLGKSDDMKENSIKSANILSAESDPLFSQNIWTTESTVIDKKNSRLSDYVSKLRDRLKSRGKTKAFAEPMTIKDDIVSNKAELNKVIKPSTDPVKPTLPQSIQQGKQKDGIRKLPVIQSEYGDDRSTQGMITATLDADNVQNKEDGFRRPKNEMMKRDKGSENSEKSAHTAKISQQERARKSKLKAKSTVFKKKLTLKGKNSKTKRNNKKKTKKRKDKKKTSKSSVNDQRPKLRARIPGNANRKLLSKGNVISSKIKNTINKEIQSSLEERVHEHGKQEKRPTRGQKLETDRKTKVGKQARNDSLTVNNEVSRKRNRRCPKRKENIIR